MTLSSLPNHVTSVKMLITRHLHESFQSCLNSIRQHLVYDAYMCLSTEILQTVIKPPNRILLGFILGTFKCQKEQICKLMYLLHFFHLLILLLYHTMNTTQA